ncbi:protein TSSC4 [Chrysoperla carnea]|uniref:protein TSSC4 n=1 Tax=Chrysoperla carnea TaxID=189513 RepID=UPI001D0922A5|nr:protein TSSC4 [Chrysoperla carnea]
MDMDIVSTENNTEFRLNATNTEFANRHNNIFGQLTKLEQSVQDNLKKNTLNNDSIERDHSSPLSILSKQVIKKKYTKSFRGKESIFKRPEAPINRCLLPRKVPDFKINPQKWKKYTLDDVTPEDLSNRQNTASALTFLRELEERKKIETIEDDITDDTEFKPTFKTSAIISDTKTTAADEDKPLFKSSVLVMPEYTVGQRKKPSKKHKSKTNKEDRKELKLDHLLEYDEDES